LQCSANQESPGFSRGECQITYKKNKAGRRIDSITFKWDKKVTDKDGNLLMKSVPKNIKARQVKQHDKLNAEITAKYYEAESKGMKEEFLDSLPSDLAKRIRERLA